MMLVSSSGMGPLAHHVDLHGLVGRVGRRAGARGPHRSSTAKAASKDHAESSHVAPSHARTSSHDFEQGTLFPAFGSCQVRPGYPRGLVRHAVLIVLARGPARARERPRRSARSAPTLAQGLGALRRDAHGQRHAARRHRRRSARQEVVLEGRRYPYEGSYRVIARTTTDADGQVPVQARAGPQPPAARHRARPGGHVRGAAGLHAAGVRALLPRAAPGRRPALPALHGAQDASG